MVLLYDTRYEKGSLFRLRDTSFRDFVPHKKHYTSKYIFNYEAHQLRVLYLTLNRIQRKLKALSGQHNHGLGNEDKYILLKKNVLRLVSIKDSGHAQHIYARKLSLYRTDRDGVNQCNPPMMMLLTKYI